MDIYDAVKIMAESTGETLQTLSTRAGRSRNYWHALRYQGSTPNVATLTEFARLCGYEIHLVGHGRDITIDAPTEASASRSAAECLHNSRTD